MMNKIDDIFNSNDIVYHYTKIQTAYEFILHTHQLRLSDRKKSNDPIENIMDRVIVQSFYGYPETKKASKEEGSKVAQFIFEKIQNSKQLCFCKNNENPELQKFMVLPSEYYGFLKPRMWDQYGDNYNGICLVFNREELKMNNPNIYSSDVEYIHYEEFYRNSNSIDLVKLHEIGFDEYCKFYFEEIRNNSFLKHTDYSGENEFRFVSFSGDETYLDIGSSLKAIILPQRNLSDFADEWFNQYANQKDIKLFYINWDNSGCRIQSNKDFQKDLDMVSKLVKKVKS